MRSFVTLFVFVAGLSVSACGNGEEICRILLPHRPAQPPGTELGISGDIAAQHLALVRRADQGDARAAYDLYRLSATVGEQRKWICVAANLGLPEAQMEIARMYWGPPPPLSFYSPFSRDIVKAYVWSRIAMRNGEPMQEISWRLTSGMSGADRLEAERLLNEWMPDPQGCE